VELHGTTVAMPLMREFLDAGQDDASVHFLFGHSLVDQGDEAGLRHLERAMEMDPGTTVAACQVAAHFLEARGRPEEAEAFVQRGQAFIGVVEQMHAERDAGTLSHKDRFLPHGLDEADAQALATFLSTVRGLERALLVRKEVTLRPEVPCYVIGVEPVWREGELDGANNPSEGLAERVGKSVQLPGTLLVVTVQKGWGLEKAIEQVPGAELYSRAAPARAGAR
jgi:hypothetical protein